MNYQRELKDYLTEYGFEGCSDGDCQIRNNKGMHTNGGCRCVQDMNKIDRFKLHVLTTKFYETKLGKIKELNEELKQCIERMGYQCNECTRLVTGRICPDCQ